MKKLLLYTTKGKSNLYMPFEHDCFETDESSRFYLSDEPLIREIDTKLNGKICAICYCDFVEEIFDVTPGYKGCTSSDVRTISCMNGQLIYRSCLSNEELEKYLKVTRDNDDHICDGKSCYGYALHLENVVVFDKPKELTDFYQIKGTFNNLFGEIDIILRKLRKAPQNMMKVYDKHGNEFILLPIKPEYMVHILNGRKTIEIRKVILKALKELIII